MDAFSGLALLFFWPERTADCALGSLGLFFHSVSSLCVLFEFSLVSLSMNLSSALFFLLSPLFFFFAQNFCHPSFMFIFHPLVVSPAICGTQRYPLLSRASANSKIFSIGLCICITSEKGECMDLLDDNTGILKQRILVYYTREDRRVLPGS